MGKLRTSGKEIKAGNLTAEEFIKSLQDEGIALGASQEDIDGAITSVKAVMNNLLGTTFASSVGEVMLASAVEEYKPSLSFGNEYKDAANNMLKIMLLKLNSDNIMESIMVILKIYSDI